MGASSTKLVQDIVNESTNESINNLFQRDQTNQSLVSENVIRQLIRTQDITSKGECQGIDIGTANIDSKLTYVANVTSSMAADIKSSLATTISSKLRQSQKIMKEMGANWGSVDNQEQDLHLRNIVTNIVENNITQETLNDQIADFVNTITQDIKVGDIVCESGKITVGAANITLEAQVDFMAKNITNQIMNNNLTQSILNDVKQEQTVEQKGLAGLVSAFLKGLLPLAIIAVAVFIGFALLGGQVTKSLLNWKLWLVVALLFGTYLLVAYLTHFWPFKKRFSVVLNDKGFRTGECKYDKNGPYDSKQKCEEALRDPTSTYFQDRFWGYDPDNKETPCTRYTQLVNIKGDKTIYASYATQEACEKDHQTIWIPDWQPNGSKADFVNKFGSQYDTDLYCSDASYGFYPSCKEGDAENVLTLPRPYFESEQECIDAIAPAKQELQFFPNCSYTNRGDVDPASCQYVKTNIEGGVDHSQGIGSAAVPFPNKDAMCG